MVMGPLWGYQCPYKDRHESSPLHPPYKRSREFNVRGQLTTSQEERAPNENHLPSILTLDFPAFGVWEVHFCSLGHPVYGPVLWQSLSW